MPNTFSLTSGFVRISQKSSISSAIKLSSQRLPIGLTCWWQTITDGKSDFNACDRNSRVSGKNTAFDSGPQSMKMNCTPLCSNVKLYKLIGFESGNKQRVINSRSSSLPGRKYSG